METKQKNKQTNKQNVDIGWLWRSMEIGKRKKREERSCKLEKNVRRERVRKTGKSKELRKLIFSHCDKTGLEFDDDIESNYILN